MNIRSILFFGCLFVAFSCGQRDNSQKVKVNDAIVDGSILKEESDEIQELAIFSDCENYDNNLSTIASKVEFISLEAEPPFNDFLITGIQFTNDYIFLSSWVEIMQYDRRGKYIKNIGSRGMGPEEFINLSAALQIDAEKELIYAVDVKRQRVLVYRFNGKLFTAFPAEYCTSISLVDTAIIAFRQSVVERNYKDCPVISFVSVDGKRKKTYYSHLYPVSFEMENLGTEAGALWENKGKYYYLEYGADTIFRIVKDTIIPARTLTGNLKPKHKDLFGRDFGRKLRALCPIQRVDAGIFESDRFMIFFMGSDYEEFYMVYHKDTKTYHRTYYPNPRIRNSMRHEIKEMTFFVDDMVSGLPFTPLYQSHGKAIALVPAATVVKKRIEIMEFIASHPSENGAKLKQIVENMTEDDNSLIMAVEFK